MTYSLNHMAIYPIKSIQGISLQSSQVNEAGLLGDRRYMLIKPDGEFVTGRRHPKLILIKAESQGQDIWQLSHPNSDKTLTLSTKHLSDEYRKVVIWETDVLGQLARQEAHDWFSDFIGEDVELVYFGEQSERFTSRRPEVSVAFADGYPFLITTQSSLDELNQSCPEHIKMAQFRPNLVIQGNKAFEEDSWKRIRIGEVEFENVKPCVRCIFITFEPETAHQLPKGEPLKTLNKFRMSKGEGVRFGINAIALNSGVISIDDPVEILEYQTPDVYRDIRKPV